MNVTVDNVLLVISVLLIISVLAGKTSYKFGVPTLIFFLIIGMLAGSEGIGGIYFDNLQAAQFIGVFALNFILFSGGLDTSWKSIKPVVWQGVLLSTIGVFLTALTVGVFVWAITDFTIYEGLLLGSIISSTDAAAVFSILRSKNLALKNKIRATLELESGSNDPMAYFLTIAFLGIVLEPEKSAWSIVPLFFQQIIIGAVGGFLFGFLSKHLINRIKLDYEGLYDVLVIALMFLTFSVTDTIGGNGFLAIYLAAIYLGNHDFIHKNSILKAFDGHAWLMQIVLFLTLGLLVFPSQVFPIMGLGLAISIFLIIAARPLSVFLTLIPFKMKIRRRLYISWVGLRGAVPIVFATFPLIAGIEKANMIFNIVFFISVTSVLIQGTTMPALAKWLRVSLPEKAKPRTPRDRLLEDSVNTVLSEFVLSDHCPAIGKKLVELRLPETSIIAMIKRNGKYLIPSGSTTLEKGDEVMALAENEESLNRVYEIMGKKMRPENT